MLIFIELWLLCFSQIPQSQFFPLLLSLRLCCRSVFKLKMLLFVPCSTSHLHDVRIHSSFTSPEPINKTELCDCICLSISRFVGTRLTGAAQIYFFFFPFFWFFLLVGRMSSVIGYVLDFPFCGNLVERHRISCLKWSFPFLIFPLII